MDETGTDSEVVEISEGYDWYPKNFENAEIGNVPVQISIANLAVDFDVFVVEFIGPLNECSWQTISAVCNNGDARAHWSVGDMKRVVIPNFTYRKAEGIATHAFGTGFNFRIMAFDHNQEVESPGVHTITFGLVGREEYEKDSVMDSVSITDRPVMSYGASFSGGTNLVNEYLDSLENALPESMTHYIKEVRKYQVDQNWEENPSDVYGLIGNYPSNDILYYNRRFFVPSLAEVFGIGQYSGMVRSETELVPGTDHQYCEQFAYYRDTVDEEKNLKQRLGWSGLTNVPWWLRTFDYCRALISDGSWLDYYHYMMVSSSGSILNQYTTGEAYVVPFFNI